MKLDELTEEEEEEEEEGRLHSTTDTAQERSSL
jgi:hypothetical protein